MFLADLTICIDEFEGKYALRTLAVILMSVNICFYDMQHEILTANPEGGCSRNC
jgi:hypothetical protein